MSVPVMSVSVMSVSEMSVSEMSGPGAKVQLQRVRAFTDQPQGGNPAGVICFTQLPSQAQLQQLARQAKQPVTAMLAPVDGGYQIRWFTPLQGRWQARQYSAQGGEFQLCRVDDQLELTSQAVLVATLEHDDW